MYETCDVII